MTRVSVHEYATALRPRYWAAKKGVKQKILDEFCETTAMHRKAAIRLVNGGGKARMAPKGVGSLPYIDVFFKVSLLLFLPRHFGDASPPT